MWKGKEDRRAPGGLTAERLLQTTSPCGYKREELNEALFARAFTAGAAGQL
jgi:hypothetical protein